MVSRFQFERLESRALFSGGLDPIFGTNGIVSGGVNYLPNGTPVAVMVRPDKRVVVAANYTLGNDPSSPSGEALVGLLANGSLDPSFGVKGIDDLGTTSLGSIFGAVMQPDGKILVIGIGTAATSELVLQRFNPDGSPDIAFASNGIATVDLPGGFSSNVQGENLTLAPDGKIITAFISSSDDPTLGDTIVGCERFNSAGQLDSTFATGGKLVLNNVPGFVTQITGIAADQFGRIVIGGDFGLIRLTQAGALDTSYGVDGQAAFQGNDAVSSGITAIAVRPNGAVVAVGTASTSETNGIFAAQFTVSGKMDKTFGKKGFKIFTFPDRDATVPVGGFSSVATVAIDSQSRTVIAGYVNQFYAGGTDFGVARLTAAGALDRSFGRNGCEAIGGGNLWPADFDGATAIYLNADGSIVVAGNSDNNEETDAAQGLVLVRERPSGALDTSFGYQGRAGIVPALPKAQFAVEQSDGKVLLAGLNAMERLTNTGTADSTFGVNGLNLSAEDYVDELRQDYTRTLAAAQVTSNGRIVELLSIQNDSSDAKTVLPFAVRSYSATGSGTGVLSGHSAARQLLHRFAGFGVLFATIQSSGAVSMIASDSNGDSIVARLTSRGALDSTFGTNGAMVLNLPGITKPTFTQIYGDASGGVILIGSGSPTDTSSTATYPVIAFRVDNRGQLDSNFGGALYSQPVGFASETTVPSTIQAADGSIYLLKSASVILHLINGAPDTSFSADGTVTLAIPTDLSAVSAGNFYVLNNRIFALSNDGGGTQKLVAFHTDGALDTTFADSGILTLPVNLAPQFLAGPDHTLTLADVFDSVVARVDVGP